VAQGSSLLHAALERKVQIMAKKRILFVDDEVNVLKGLRRVLHDESDMWDLSFANNPRAAMDLLLGMPFDVVVLDVNMPGQDGIDLLVDIKSDEKLRGVEVILLTGLTDENLKHEAIDLGAIDLLRKPVVKGELVSRLRSALRIKGFRDELQEKNQALEEELIRSQKVELAGTLAAGAAHDLNNILNVIVGYTALALEKAAEDEQPKGMAEMVAKIEQAGLRAAKIVQQIVKFAKNRETTTELCSFDAIIKECIDMLQVCIPGRIKVEMSDQTESSLIKANGTEIFQTVMNLCINGVQAMGAQGTLSLGLRRVDSLGSMGEPATPIGPHLELAVRDTGPGMDPATVERIFDTGFTTKGSDGCGLGLSVVHRIVTGYGGSIRIESEVGQGTTFFVLLPAEYGPTVGEA
jgi:signal transduction histidine kinase